MTHYKIPLGQSLMDKSVVNGKIEVSLVYKTKPARTVDLTTTDGYYVLSIVGEINRYYGGSSSGQNYDDLLAAYHYHPLVKWIVPIWKRWHLNNLRAGTRAQNEAVSELPPATPNHKGCWFDRARDYLKHIDLYTDAGYTYGNSWLVECIPEDVLKEINTVLELHRTD